MLLDWENTPVTESYPTISWGVLDRMTSVPTNLFMLRVWVAIAVVAHLTSVPHGVGPATGG
jgi:hypothetical protein